MTFYLCFDSRFEGSTIEEYTSIEAAEAGAEKYLEFAEIAGYSNFRIIGGSVVKTL